ncbi:hypothetical protein C9374_010600 [Naegleria lovaniensis]|uniref:non-specific serine/threonine protein kinase n=1 Tax=Naegleria lovaniensis TaxID=51637 RepID=A0AA88GI58_NAELO|nr:uncharacterized protein C9374_010600 [Naegleria lovaniensis]KAG2374581.1 hypothetical protein C9374_010600 [Naegleria lovaniensis]
MQARITDLTREEEKIIYNSSMYVASMDPLYRSIDTLLRESGVDDPNQLPPHLKQQYDGIKYSLQMMEDQLYSIGTLVSSISIQVYKSPEVGIELRTLFGVLIRHLYELGIYKTTFLSMFIQLSFGTRSKTDYLMELLHDERVYQYMKSEIEGSVENHVLLAPIMPVVAKNDWNLFVEKYEPLYFLLNAPSGNAYSYASQVYEAASKHPKSILPYLKEAINGLVVTAEKEKSESKEQHILNSVFNLVNSNPEALFNSPDSSDLLDKLNKIAPIIFDTNKPVMTEIFSIGEKLKESNEADLSFEDGEYLLMVEYNGKKKKIKEKSNHTLASLLQVVFEKYQIEEDCSNLNNLYDKGYIVEYFENGINDWIEFEWIEDIPKTPSVAKIRITKEKVENEQMEQIVERNTNIQLVNEKYQILKRLGKGGFGTVYLANNFSDVIPTLAALKYIEIDSVINFNRSMREGIQMLQLDHPNIAKIFDVFEVQSSDIGLMGVETKRYLCFAMPYYSHGDLYDLVKNAPHILTPIMIRSIMKQLMESLAYLHDEMSIVHRDIKPQNVLIDSINIAAKTLKPILSDFGLAKTLLKTETQIAGTASYMSPEMTTRKGYDLKTDVWSMGVMFYQLVSVGDFVTDVKGKILENDVNYLRSQINRAWSSGSDADIETISVLTGLTFDMLKIDPDERLSSNEILQRLQ